MESLVLDNWFLALITETRIESIDPLVSNMESRVPNRYYFVLSMKSHVLTVRFGVLNRKSGVLIMKPHVVIIDPLVINI